MALFLDNFFSQILFALSFFVGLCAVWWLFCRFCTAGLNQLALWHRRRNEEFQAAWDKKTLPHTRPLVQKPNFKTITGWKLECEKGCQRWKYCGEKHQQNFLERYQLGLEADSHERARKNVSQSIKDGIDFLERLQDLDGHWPNDYSGPMFLLPGAVFAKYCVCGGNQKKMWPEQHLQEFLRYLTNLQNWDGGWGMHTEGQSTMIGTVLNYAAFRLLGGEKDCDVAQNARRWIKIHGGALSCPSWGKVWLCVMNLYSWSGMNPVPPEMWLLPDWLPFSMGRTWCHSRLVALSFAYLYGAKYQCPLDSLIASIREEIYPLPYDQISWPTQRSNIFKGDIYSPLSSLFRVANALLIAFEKFHSPALRKYALKYCYKHVQYDDDTTDFICLGPVNKALNFIINFLEEGADSHRVRKHCERLEDYMWLGREGMRMSGYNGSQLWDTSFAVQAVCACDMQAQYKQMLASAHKYVDIAQVKENPPKRKEFYRSRTKGAWNFSTANQSWQVSDCTAEGLRVVLLLRKEQCVLGPKAETQFPEARIFDAVDEILALRNKEYGNGGWASYEEIRGPAWVELLDCADIYKDVMVEYEYTECTSSCVQTLAMFRKQFPFYRSNDICRAIEVGVEVIKNKQRQDGSWYGSWGVCFTYGAFFAIEALQAAAVPRTEDTYVRAAQFLLSKQRPDGGWGEDFNSCVTQRWCEHPDGSQTVNTAWAVIALCGCFPRGAAANPLDPECSRLLSAIRKGVQLLMSRQLENGDWDQKRITGVFNGNCAIHYPSYKNNMTIWALGKYASLYRNIGEKFKPLPIDEGL